MLSLLLKETREAFDNEAATTGRERLLFTSAVGAGKAVVDTAYDVPVMAKYGHIFSLTRLIIFSMKKKP